MVAMPLYGKNGHGERITIGEYDRLKGNVILHYSKTKDEFANKITLRVPDILPSNTKKVQIFDKDYEELADLPIELAKKMVAEAKGGIYKVAKADVKFIR